MEVNENIYLKGVYYTRGQGPNMQQKYTEKLQPFNLMWVKTIEIYLVCALFINSNLG